jgi:hypothetical protein
MVFSKVEKASKITSWNENNHYWNTEPKTYAEKLQANNKIPLYGKVTSSVLISLILWGLGYLLIYETFTLLKIIGLITVAVLLIIGIVYYFVKSDTPERIKDSIVEFFSMIKEAFYSFKDNYCPKINWKD